MSRKKMTPKETRSKILKFRVTPTEQARVLKWVEESGMDLPDYLRRVVLQGIVFRIEANTPEKIYVESTKFEETEDIEGPPKRRHAGG